LIRELGFSGHAPVHGDSQSAHKAIKTDLQAVSSL
jgi:hypothetical protein